MDEVNYFIKMRCQALMMVTTKNIDEQSACCSLAWLLDHFLFVSRMEVLLPLFTLFSNSIDPIWPEGHRM
jgi:hypothetical protein